MLNKTKHATLLVAEGGPCHPLRSHSFKRNFEDKLSNRRNLEPIRGAFRSSVIVLSVLVPLPIPLRLGLAWCKLCGLVYLWWFDLLSRWIYRQDISFADEASCETNNLRIGLWELEAVVLYRVKECIYKDFGVISFFDYSWFSLKLMVNVILDIS